MIKHSVDLSPGSSAREHEPKSDFALPGKHPKGHAETKGKYPMPDKAHERAALGFAAMHHGKDSAEYKAVARKAHEKFGEAFDRGFIKAAVANGIGVLQAVQLLKLAEDNLSTAVRTGLAGKNLGVLGSAVAGGLGGSVGEGIRGALFGMPVGAIVGGINEYNKPKDQRHYFNAILDNAGVGGLIGGAGGALIGGGAGALAGGMLGAAHG